MKIIRKKIWFLFLLTIIAIASSATIVFAADSGSGSANIDSPAARLNDVAAKSGYTGNVNPTDLPTMVGVAVKAFLSILGIIFIVLMLYSGYTWMMARGDQTKVDKAKDTIREAIIGLVITVSAYAIWAFIYYSLIQTG